MGVWDQFYERAKSFFANAEDGRADVNKNKKRCYYDLLEVDKNSTEDEIKRSFKKLALKWHPDKNPDRSDECTAYFILIQQAYEVLIDPHERSFYDRHRENILHRNGGDDVDETKDTGIDLKPFMKTSAWEGMFTMKTEDEQIEKFYAIYRDLFHNISAEEYAYIDDIEDRNFPVFGKADSDFETIVAPFYAFWSDFSTCRSFAWLDKWNLREASDRATMRAMEKENKKLRELGKRQRNEDIRVLVTFVRKHDKRVAQQKEYLKRKADEQRKKAEETRLHAIRRNLESVQLELEEFNVDEAERLQHLAHLEEIENELDANFGTVMPEGNVSSVDEEVEDSNNYCIVCEKAFKNSKSFLNHQRSKKHRQAVDELRIHMKIEDQNYFIDDQPTDVVNQVNEQKPKHKKKRKQKEKDLEKVSADESNVLKKPEIEISQNLCETTNKNSNTGEPFQSEEVHKNKKHSKDQRNLQKQKTELSKATFTGIAEPIISKCQTCGEEFPSRSKLFSHLKESGHATVKIPSNSTKANSSTSRKKR